MLLAVAPGSGPLWGQSSMGLPGSGELRHTGISTSLDPATGTGAASPNQLCQLWPRSQDAGCWSCLLEESVILLNKLESSAGVDTSIRSHSSSLLLPSPSSLPFPLPPLSLFLSY